MKYLSAAVSYHITYINHFLNQSISKRLQLLMTITISREIVTSRVTGSVMDDRCWLKRQISQL